MTLDEAIRALVRAADKLAPEQGRIARRNARALVLRRLRDARSALDADFPAIAKPRTPGNRARGRLRRITEAADRRAAGEAVRRGGQTASARAVVTMDEAAAITRAGFGAQLQAHTLGRNAEVSAPTWLLIAVRAGSPKARIREAIRSPKARAALVGWLALGGGGAR